MSFRRGADQLLLRRELVDGNLTYVGYRDGVEEVAAFDPAAALKALLSKEHRLFQASSF